MFIQNHQSTHQSQLHWYVPFPGQNTRPPQTAPRPTRPAQPMYYNNPMYLMMSLLSMFQQLQSAWQGFGMETQYPASPLPPGMDSVDSQHKRAIPATPTAKPSTPQFGGESTSSVPGGGGSRILADGKAVDPLGREGYPVKGRDGKLLYVKAKSHEELRAYEAQSRKILSKWDVNNLPGEPLLGDRKDMDYVGWAEKHFPGGFTQYRHNRSNSRTGVEDHEQLRQQLALSRNIPVEQVDYREVMWLYGQGGNAISTARSRATADIWRRDPPGTPSNPSDKLRTYRKQDWEALWALAPETKPKNWTWPDNWKPMGPKT